MAPAPLAARASPSRPAFAAFSGNPIAPGVACALVFALRSVIAAISRRTSSTMDCSRSLWRRCRKHSTRWFALRATRQTKANDTHVLHCCMRARGLPRREFSVRFSFRAVAARPVVAHLGCACSTTPSLCISRLPCCCAYKCLLDTCVKE